MELWSLPLLSFLAVYVVSWAVRLVWRRRAAALVGGAFVFLWFAKTSWGMVTSLGWVNARGNLIALAGVIPATALVYLLFARKEQRRAQANA